MISRDGACSVGFDLGGTKMLATVFDADFHPLASQRKKTKGNDGARAGLDRIATTIEEALERARIERRQLAAVGIGCPGPLDLDEGVLLDAPNLGWRDVPLKAELERRLRCQVFVSNDVDAGVYGEYRFGAGQGARCVLGVFPGTGIGGGCVYEGRIFRGRRGSCMEIGHVPVVPGGPVCGCGRQGCLEAVASRLAISAAAAQAVHRGQAPHLQTIAGTDLAEIRSGALAAAIDAGDDVVRRIVLEAARHLGTALAGAVNLLAPDIIVLGGGLVEALAPILVPAVESAVRQQVMPAFERSFEVVAARLGDEATAMGSAAWAQHCLNGGIA